MPHTDAFYHWSDRVQALFPDLRPHHRRALAEYSFGPVLARYCGLSSAVAHLAGFLALSAHALRQRLRELDQPAAAQRGCARTELTTPPASARCCAGPPPATPSAGWCWRWRPCGRWPSGGEGEPAAVPEVARPLGAPRPGLLRRLLALLPGQPLPRGRLEHHPWPEPDGQADPLTEPLIDQC